MTNIAISVRNLTKDFEIYEKPRDVALELLTGRKRHRSFRALDQVSFDVERGQVLGIIGANGAGKSTLLKIVTGVLDATGGAVSVSGRVTAILELGLGFNHEHSGHDNIFLSGMLYGMSREEINRKLDAIIEFSGLRAFIEQPVRTYSSGMMGRLAFSIATAVDPDILIIDEALAAGDAMFVQKSMRRIRQLCAAGRTALVVSHGTPILAQLCRDVLWLENGRIRMNGRALPVIQAYDLEAHRGADAESWIEPAEDAMLAGTGGESSHSDNEAPLPIPAEILVSTESVQADILAETEPVPTDVPPLSDHTPSDDQAAPAPAVSAAPSAAANSATLIAREAANSAFSAANQAPGAADQTETGKYVFRRGPVFIDSVTMFDHLGKPSTRLTTLQPFALRVAYHCKGPLPDETLGVALAINRLADLEPVLQWYTQFIRPDETRETFAAAPFRVRAGRRGMIDVSFPYAPFREGDYLLSIGLLPNAPGTWEFFEYRHLFYPFYVNHGALGIGAPIFFEPSKISFTDLSGEVEESEAASA